MAQANAAAMRWAALAAAWAAAFSLQKGIHFDEAEAAVAAARALG